MAKKNKIKVAKSRNPFAVLATQRPGGAMHTRTQDVRRGSSRKAKHRNKRDW